jgi:hypothetical protein
LWRKEGLKVPGGKQRKRLRLAEGGSENGCRRKRAGHRDHVWSYDFVMDETEDDRRLKMMPVLDEYTRECLAIEVERSITAEDVIGTLARLFGQRGAPAFIRRSGFPLPAFAGTSPAGMTRRRGLGPLRRVEDPDSLAEMGLGGEIRGLR